MMVIFIIIFFLQGTVGPLGQLGAKGDRGMQVSPSGALRIVTQTSGGDVSKMR